MNLIIWLIKIIQTLKKAVKKNSIDMVRILITAKANTDVQDNLGKTALIYGNQLTTYKRTLKRVQYLKKLFI